jgi:hypothetical protein
MGLKDWIAGNVAGPRSYGDALGRKARENGSALANVLFMSHGTKVGEGPAVIFDSTEQMEAAGFEPRFEEMTEVAPDSLSEDERLLFRNLQTAMISFAFMVNSNGALQNMRRENTTKFRNGLGPSLLKSMVDCGLFDKFESAQASVLSYLDSVNSARPSTVLNMEKPGSGDLLEHFIGRAVEVSDPKCRYGFTRTKSQTLDLNMFAVTLVEETLKSIVGATLHYKW